MSGHHNQRCADHRRLPSDSPGKEVDPYHAAVDGQQPADSSRSQESKGANNTDSPEAQHDLYGPAPEGGLRAWLAAAGGGAVYFATLGFANSFGTFEEYYRSHQLSSSSASKISWIGSLAIFLQFFTGMLSGPLFDRYGQKVSEPAQKKEASTRRPFPSFSLPFVALVLTRMCFVFMIDHPSGRIRLRLGHDDAQSLQDLLGSHACARGPYGHFHGSSSDPSLCRRFAVL